MLFPTLKNKFGVKKNPGGGGGGIMFLSHFTFYAIFNIKKNIYMPLHLLVKWEVVSPNSR